MFPSTNLTSDIIFITLPGCKLNFTLFYRWLATTQFEPVDARAAFPCFDEPSMKAYFSLSMIRDKDHIALFNMPKLNTKELDNGLFEDR